MASPEVEKTTENTVLKPENDVFSRQLDETKPVKSRKRLWKGLGLSVLALTAGGAAFLKFTPGAEELPSLISGGIKGRLNPNLLFDHAGSQVNILLIGRDVNWKIGKVFDPKTGKYRPFQVHDENTPARSDTMIVVSLNKDTKTIRMVSLPRDASIRLPENKYGVHRAKLNAAHAYGGPDLLIKTLKDELGLTIHRHAVIKFDGFKNLIDEVGGVEVKVDGALKKGADGKLYRGNLDYDDNWGNLHIHLKPGTQRLDGITAHNYVRFRMDREGDPGRIRRQQQVMRALAKQMAHVSLLRLPGLIQEVQKQFATDMTTEELSSAAAFAQSIGDASKIQPLTLFGIYSTRGGVLLNRPKNEKLLSYIFGSTFDPNHFLQRSPSTREDEFGPANDASPEAIKLLQDAGILKSPDALKENPGNEAPVRVEESLAQADEPRHSRYAAANDVSDDAEKPRRSRRRTHSVSRESDERQSDKSSRETRSRETSDKTAEESHRSRPRRENLEERSSHESPGSESIINDTPARHESASSHEESAHESSGEAPPMDKAP